MWEFHLALAESDIVMVPGYNMVPSLYNLNKIQEDALWPLTKLMRLQMKGDNLNTYTTSFNDLKEVAGFKDDALGIIIAYRQGLKQPLHNVILDRQWPRVGPQPNKLLKWQDATH